MSEETKNEEVVEKTTETTEAEAPKEEVKAEAPVEEVTEEVEVPAKFKDLVEKIENMSVIDLHELVKLFEKKFGVSAAAVAVAGGAVAEAGEEKTSFDVELTSAGDQKIAVIKAVKGALGLGLKEAKDATDNVPFEVLKDAKPEDVKSAAEKLKAAGATIELK